MPSIHPLWPYLLKHFSAQNLHLSNELLPQLAVIKVLNILQISFILRRPDHRETILLFEVVVNQATNFVLLFNCVGRSFLRLESILKVLS